MVAFDNRVAVITGAASGIGFALAQHAAAKGMKLVLADIDFDRLQVACRDAGFETDRLLTVKTDVSRVDDIAVLADSAFKRFGSVHLLCNNAGVAMTRMIWELSEEDWKWVLGVNLWSVIHGVRLFLPRMMNQSDGGHIVNTASAAGLLTMPSTAAYNVSKHGVVALSETLYMELQSVQSKVDVSVLCPAWVPTAINRVNPIRPERFGSPSAMGELSTEFDKKINSSISSGTLSASDIATCVFEAVSEHQFYIIPHRRLNQAIESRLNDIINLRNPKLPS